MKKTLALLALVLLLVPNAGLSPAAANGPLEIQVTERDSGRAVDLNGEVLVLNLESNPSTGYGWQVQALDARILRQLDTTEWLPDTPGKLGGPGTEVLRFAAVGEGRGTLDLVYARPWETAAAPAKSFSLEVNVAEPSRNVSYPQPAAQEPLEVVTGMESLDALPSSYNWCDLGKCTDVRDQGQCGSCWAFGTVGPLESAILIQDGLSKDLAEQYLVSCNTDGWGCDGGWWAHDYHEWKYPPGEPGPGSVYEDDFPYTATDASCDGPYTHHETIADWVFIGSESGVPSTDAIKQAIYDHGPVSAALCVNSTFQAYTGGVFNPPGWCLTINHAITLVGWDDSKGAWRLRNSWGDDWGEAGYMWIAYGKYFVGYSANYVVYEGSTPPTPPAAPSDLVATAAGSDQIDLSWTDNASDEAGFKIERCTGEDCNDFAQIATVGANVTSYQDSGLEASTLYYYRAYAYNAAGDSPYSNVANATTTGGEPPLTVHVGDLDGSSVEGARARWEATVSITVHDSNEVVVSGALVEGNWGGGAQGGGSCTTNVSGQCSVIKTNLKANVDSVTFSVSNVTSGTGDYAAGDNHDPDGDSDGTTVVVSKPGSNIPPVVTITTPTNGASFESGVTISFVGSASDTEDGDLTASLSWTSSIDGAIGTGGAFDTVLSDGAHIITAEVADSGGANGSDAINITVGSVETVVMHVGDLDGISVAAPRNRWEAIVTITIHDASDSLVANAIVSGFWSVDGDGSCTTDGAGQCSITKSNIKSNVSSTDFTVTGVTRYSGDTYDRDANHDPDGDSNGTAITILKPD